MRLADRSMARRRGGRSARGRAPPGAGESDPHAAASSAGGDGDGTPVVHEGVHSGKRRELLKRRMEGRITGRMKKMKRRHICRRLCVSKTCRRYRDRKNREWVQLMRHAVELERRLAGWQDLERDNQFLRGAVRQLEAVLRDQQCVIQELQKLREVGSPAESRFGVLPRRLRLERRCSGTSASPTETPTCRRQPETMQAAQHRTGLMHRQLEEQTQALRNFLAAKSIREGAHEAGAEDVQALTDMLAAIVESSVALARSRVPKPCDLACHRGRHPGAGPGRSDVEKCVRCLRRLKLSPSQKAAVVNLRREQEAQLGRVYEARAMLNDQ
eukprot:evm.model.scf_762.8 EVM.evm.TU.scf_762.8   scf_762:51562-58360(+)